MSIALRLSLTFVKFLFAIVLFVFVYKGKNFYRGGKRERGWCGVAAEGGIVVASFSLICVGRMWERGTFGCVGGEEGGFLAEVG